MKKIKKHKIRIYQDSKELPFLNYKRIIQTGDFYYLVKGYEPGDEVDYDIAELEKKFQQIEEDYAASINTKNSDVLIYGEAAIVINEFNKFNILLLFVEQAIKAKELRTELQNLLQKLLNEGKKTEAKHIEMLMTLSSEENADFGSSEIKDLLKDFKIQKSEDLNEQRQFIKNRLEKLNNQLSKLNSQIEKNKESKDNSEFDIEEQFVSVCVGLEIPVDDKNITLYQYGLMIKALVKRVEEINKMNRDAR